MTESALSVGANMGSRSASTALCRAATQIPDTVYSEPFEDIDNYKRWVESTADQRGVPVYTVKGQACGIETRHVPIRMLPAQPRGSICEAGRWEKAFFVGGRGPSLGGVVSATPVEGPFALALPLNDPNILLGVPALPGVNFSPGFLEGVKRLVSFSLRIVLAHIPQLLVVDRHDV